MLTCKVLGSSWTKGTEVIECNRFIDDFTSVLPSFLNSSYFFTCHSFGTCTFIVEWLLMALGWTSFVSLWGCLLSWWSCATHQRWWQGYPGAYRDQPGWHPWFACCRGSPYHQRCRVGFCLELQNISKKELRDHACRVHNTSSHNIFDFGHFRVSLFFLFYFPRSAGRWHDESCCCGCSRNGASMCGWCRWHHGGLRCCKTHCGLRHSDWGTNPYHWRKHRRGDGGRGSNSPLAMQTDWTDSGPHLVYTGRRHNNQIEPD